MGTADHVGKWSEMVRSGRKWSEMVGKGRKRSEMVVNGRKWLAIENSGQD